MLNENIEFFIVYMIFLNSSLILIYLLKEAQIGLLITNKVNISKKYSDFSNLFLEGKTLVLS